MYIFSFLFTSFSGLLLFYLAAITKIKLSSTLQSDLFFRAEILCVLWSFHHPLFSVVFIASPVISPHNSLLLLIVTRCLLRRNCGDLVPSPRRLSDRVISHKFCIATPQSGAFQRPRCLCSRLSSDDTRMKSISYSRYEGRYTLP